MNIPDSVKSIGTGAFIGCAITSITIPESVDSIGAETFWNCQQLASVTIPNSVKKIGNSAFWGCRSLESITIPDSVTVINEGVFHGCASLTSVTFGKSVKEIGELAFSGSGLTSITFPSSIETIGNGAFTHCDGLKSVNIPSPIKNIGDQAFDFCDNLDTLICNTDIGTVFQNIPSIKVVIVGDDVTSIPAHAFENCKRLAFVIIPQSVKTIGENAFWGCNKLAKVQFGSIASLCGMNFENVQANPLFFAKHLYIGGSEVIDLVIPDSVTSISDIAFINCASLKSVTIPASVKTIGTDAFNGCERLTKAEFASIESLCEMKFGNVQTNPLYYAKHLYINGAEVFDLEIPNTVETIEANTFVNGASLKSVKIPASVKNIGDDAFAGCEGLVKAEFASLESLCGIKFGTVLSNPLYYARHLYIDGAEITDLAIPNSMAAIGDFAFANCGSLKSVKIPASVKTIGTDAFVDCKGLTKAEFASIESLCGTKFSTIPSNPLNYAKHLYIDGAEVTDLKIPNSVKSIGIAAFAGCEGLTSVTIPNTVTHIGDWAFSNCDGLKTVIIPKSVESLGYGAFANCTATIYCEFEVIPDDWNSRWNGGNYAGEIILNSTGPHTAVAKSSTDAINIYAYGKTIVVENATDEIRVYDTMGNLICRDAFNRVRTEIRVDGIGVYIVKIGNVAKRVLVK